MRSEKWSIIMAKQYSVTVNGTVYDVIVEEVGAAPVAAPAARPAAPSAAPVAPKAPAAPAAAPAAPAGAGEKIEAPLNGNVLDVKVSNGASVKKGDLIFIIEAMKMENEILAPKDGTITSVVAQKGATVNAGDVLATIA